MLGSHLPRNTPVSSSGFSILDSAPDFVVLRILESLQIFKLNPSINDTNSSFPLYIVEYFFPFLKICCILMCLYFIIILLTFTVLFLRNFIVVQFCTDDETSISKRLNKDDAFTYRLHFSLPNSPAIQAKQSPSIYLIMVLVFLICLIKHL